MRKLTVSAIQTDVKLGDFRANLEKMTSMIEKAGSRGSNLIVLPEMWLLGFDYEAMEETPASDIEDTLNLLGDLAYKFKSFIVSGTLAEVSEGRHYNTSYLIDPSGKVAGKYRKVHLFSEIGEKDFFTPGTEIAHFETHVAKIGIAICYDIRFPELFRKMALRGVEIICVPAQFPHPRLEHWDVLLRSRAIENQLFVVGCNRVGKMKNINYFGHSMIVGPYGEIIEEGGEGEGIITETIDLEKVYEIRKILPSLSQRRPDVYSGNPAPEEPPIPGPQAPKPYLPPKKHKPFKFKNTIQPMKPRDRA
jgi:predicted amidohydrolase